MYVLQTVTAVESTCCHTRALLHNGIHGLVDGWAVTAMQRWVCCGDSVPSRLSEASLLFVWPFS